MNTTFSYDHYYLQDEIEDHIKALAEKHSDIMSWEYLLETPDKHHIIAVTLTNKATGGAQDKPAFHIDGNTHAGEVTGMMAAMHTMDYLVTSYGNEDKVTDILDRFAVYIIPCVSPDGSQTYLTTPYTLRSVNRSYYKELGEGLAEEDLDDDGVIRMVRFKTPYGAWKLDRDGQLTKRLPDDVEGEFYDVYTEGEIEGYDGIHVHVKKDKWGLDFNRNYPFGWFPESRQPGAGQLPLCNPETKTMAQWIVDHPNICSVATNHTSGGVLLTVPGTYSTKKADSEDMRILSKLADMGTETTGYKHIGIYDSFMTDQEMFDSGAFDDYCYETKGIYAMTLELWDLDLRCGLKQFWDEDPSTINEGERFLAYIKWAKENSPEAYSEWKAFKHPQLGDTEIGGFNYKFLVQNPPVRLLKQECEKITAYMIRWIRALPSLVADRFCSEELGEGIFRVSAVISNRGYLPTYLSRKAQKLGESDTVKVTIEGAGEVVSGSITEDIGSLSSYALTKTGVWYYGNISTDEGEPISKKVSWIVKGKKGDSIKLTACSSKAGKSVVCGTL